MLFSWAAMPSLWIIVPAIIVAIVSITHGIYPTSLPSALGLTTCPSSCRSNILNPRFGYLDHDCTDKPFQSSWNSWFHPQRSDGDLGLGAGAVTKDWNILYHLGGNGPWVEKTIDVVDGGIAPPDGCEVVQVHMMSRHAERYPTMKAGRKQKAVVQRMKDSGIAFTGNLAFFNDWDLFWTSDETQLEQLTTTGPFAGILNSFTTGVRLRTRYQHLLDQIFSTSSNQTTTFWASDSNRVIETAKHFAAGFFGLDYNTTNTAALQVISEKSSVGADTLTPGRTCLANKKDAAEGQQKGYRLTHEYRATYMPPIRERLLNQTGMNFTDHEIYAMQEMCGFETTVRGRSDWCNVFTREEFLSFEYARDVLHYYRAGPGQRYATSMGWLWLNATTNLLLEGPEGNVAVAKVF
jgi:acid phosphatase